MFTMKCSFHITRLSTIIFIVFSAAVFASCNKSDNTKSTTIVKCVTCANGGLCINDTCRCPAGYEGTSCQTLSSQKFLSSWNVIEKGTLTSSRTYSIEIQNNFSLSINSVQVSNFYNYFFFTPVTGTVSSDTLYIPSQHAQGKIIAGIGYIHSDPSFGQFGAITMRYMVTDSITGQIDDFGYNSSTDSPSQWRK